MYSNIQKIFFDQFTYQKIYQKQNVSVFEKIML